MSRSDFTTVRVVGGLLPTDLLGRVLAGDKDLGGLTGTDYHLAAGETAREAANRAWPYLLGAWTTYRQALAKLPEGDPAVGLTREKWLNALFKELDYGRLQPTPPGGLTADDKSFPVSHLWGAMPLHLLGWGVELDKRTKGVPGAAERAPQAMLQELLNRSDDYLWGMLSNGRTLRLLRDSTSLAGQSYVEFDLESMFDGEVFSDFVLLYLLLHQSRVEVSDGGVPADSWLEKWRTSAAETGTRALGLLRDGVKDALEALGSGFLQTPGNDLNERLAAGTLRLDDYQRSLLRLVYRLLFLFVSEDRGLLLDPNADPLAVRRYQDYYSTARLRTLARKRRGARHVDQWQGLQLVIDALGREGGLPQLGLPGLGGIFASEPVDVVMRQHLPNEALLTAVRKLSVVQPKGSPPRVVDYRNLGAEELGSIYESLLELIPRHDQLERTFTLELLAGNDRKTSGSYYTPTSLIDLVLDQALDPLLDERERQGEEALLSMTVCDPACGSGHFLVAAARRIATRLAMVRTGEADPTPSDVQHALHDVVARCIYGVDLNPMAAELAKVSLWLEAMEPGRPLGFLDAHIKVGNALLGTTPRLIAEGIPDAAFDPIEGDDKKYASSLKKRNKVEREQSLSGHQQGGLFDEATIDVSNAHLRAHYVEAMEQTLKAVDLIQLSAAEARYREAQRSQEAMRSRLIADTWCAAFVQELEPGAVSITQATIEQAAAKGLTTQLRNEVDRLSATYRFFHWHLEFPGIFQVPTSGPMGEANGWSGGFTAMLGNPPWETVQMSEREFFASRDSAIAQAKTAAIRKRMIAELRETNPALYDEFVAESRRSQAENKMVRGSGRYPLTAHGKTNTYSLFAEAFRSAISRDGRAGVITPTGLLTGATTQEFAKAVLGSRTLAAFLDFRNENFFEGVANAQGVRFAIVCLSGRELRGEALLLFGGKTTADVNDPRRTLRLSAEEIQMLNPNTGTLPAFRSRRDAEVTLGIYRRFPVLVRDGDPEGNPWELQCSQGLFNTASDSRLFFAAEDLRALGAEFDGWEWAGSNERWLPLLEAKMIHLYDDRFGTYSGVDVDTGLGIRAIPTPSDDQHDDPAYCTQARYWVNAQEVESALGGRHLSWLMGWRDITAYEAVRTFISSAFPVSAVGDPILLVRSAKKPELLLTLWSSLAFDFISRQKLTGTHMKFFLVKQLAAPHPDSFMDVPSWSDVSLEEWLRPRLMELAYTSHRMSPLALALGDGGAPFRWQSERRDALMAEMDAAFMMLYDLTRPEVEHILDTFEILRKYEERDFGEFRTRRLVLAEYDRMAEATATQEPYESTLDPAPGLGTRHDAATIPDRFKEHS